MATVKTLTAANSALTLLVRGLFPVPQAIQGYATDDSFAADDVTPVETMMGVDGLLSAGFVPYTTKFNITLQADSDSTAMFDVVMAQQKASLTPLIFDGTLVIGGTQEKYALTKGFLVSATPMSTAKKVLQPRKFTIEFQDVTKAPT